MRHAEVEEALLGFEGLIFTTTILLKEAGVEMDIEDIRQTLRIKAWRAVLAYDTSHPRGMQRDRFVFMCIANMKKDLLKRPRRGNASVDELRERPIHTHHTDPGAIGDWFDGRFLSVSAEEVYFEVEDEPVVLPSTLDMTERRAIALLTDDPDLTLLGLERALGLSRAGREALMHSIRAKLADWRPRRARAPKPPLPRAGRRAPRARAAQAA